MTSLDYYEKGYNRLDNSQSACTVERQMKSANPLNVRRGGALAIISVSMYIAFGRCAPNDFLYPSTNIEAFAELYPFMEAAVGKDM